MKKTGIILIAGILMFSAGSVMAQCKLKSGDVASLKGQAKIGLRYDYSEMAVGKYKSEKEYVDDKVAEMNKKKAGSGDEWAKKWTGDRTERFQPAFETSLNNEVKKYQSTFAGGSDEGKYMLVVHTMFTEPGFNAVVGGIRKNANVTLKIDLVESANPGIPLATIEMKNVQSSAAWGYDYDTGKRIESSYDKAGEELGSFLVKNVFKK
jgi:hypothetical protein